MNVKTKIDEWDVRDLEDNTITTVLVEHNSEMGNKSLPGIQVISMGQIVNYEPLHVEQWAYAAKKAGKQELLLEPSCWMVHEDRFVKHYLVTGEKLKAKIEVKVRSKDKPVVKEYELPFSVDL